MLNKHGWPQTVTLHRQSCFQRKHICPGRPGCWPVRRKKDSIIECTIQYCTTEFETRKSGKCTRALLMYSSWQAFPFSFLPPQALRAEACRARPYEKVRAQGLCRGHMFMAFRLMEASSSLWPPDRKVTPAEEKHKSLAKHHFRPLSKCHTQ